MRNRLRQHLQVVALIGIFILSTLQRSLLRIAPSGKSSSGKWENRCAPERTKQGLAIQLVKNSQPGAPSGGYVAELTSAFPFVRVHRSGPEAVRIAMAGLPLVAELSELSAELLSRPDGVANSDMLAFSPFACPGGGSPGGGGEPGYPYCPWVGYPCPDCYS